MHPHRTHIHVPVSGTAVSRKGGSNIYGMHIDFFHVLCVAVHLGADRTMVREKGSGEGQGGACCLVA